MNSFSNAGRCKSTIAAGLLFGFILLAQVGSASADGGGEGSVGLTAMCSTRDGGSLMRINSPSRNTTATLKLYGTTHKVTVFAAAGTNTYVFMPDIPFGSVGTVVMGTDPDVGQVTKATNANECTQNLTINSTVVDPLGIAPGSNRSVTITGSGGASGTVKTLSVPKNGTASVSVPATVANGSTTSSPSGGYSYSLTEPDLQGAAYNSFVPATLTARYGDIGPSSLLTDTYPGLTLATNKPAPVGALLQEPVIFTVTNLPTSASGTATVKDGTTVLGSCTLAAGTCQVSLPGGFVHSGSRVITAVYSDGAGYSATSAPLTQVVVPITANAPTLDTDGLPVPKGAVITTSSWGLNNVYAGANPYPTPVFRWQQCLVFADPSSCTDITGGTGTSGASYGTRDRVIALQLRLRISWMTIEGLLTVFSDLSGLTDPTSVSAPVLNSSAPIHGRSVHSSFGVWNGYVAGVSTVSFAWKRCSSQSDVATCTVTVGAGQNYKPTAADVGKHLRVRAAIDTRGRGASSWSTATGVVH